MMVGIATPAPPPPPIRRCGSSPDGRRGGRSRSALSERGRADDFFRSTAVLTRPSWRSSTSFRVTPTPSGFAYGSAEDVNASIGRSSRGPTRTASSATSPFFLPPGAVAPGTPSRPSRPRGRGGAAHLEILAPGPPIRCLTIRQPHRSLTGGGGEVRRGLHAGCPVTSNTRHPRFPGPTPARP